VAEARRLPEGFLWATATAAHQVEGGNRNNDWWRWEQAPGHVRNGDKSGVACDHYHRFREDFALLREMRNNAHRLSIEWSRVEPREGEFDAGEIRHYREVVDELRQQGMAPMVTLFHFTSPLWFADRGGWEARGSPQLFVRFVRRIAGELGDAVAIWCTINEPNIYATQGWLFGNWPPGRRNDIRGVWRVLTNLRHAHEAAYSALKECTPDVPVGLAHNRYFLVAARRLQPVDQVAAGIGRTLMDRWPARRGRWSPTVAATSDYIGLNHYSGRLLRGVRQVNPPGFPISDFGDAVRSDWMRQALVDLKRFRKPVYVTESGIATTDDKWRQRFLQEYLDQVRGAIVQDGVDVRGYFYWTSMDNFEWAHGYTMKFGLIEVDRKTLERRPKPSAGLYGRMAAANAIVDS
jgi:beta-glucosidase